MLGLCFRIYRYFISPAFQALFNVQCRYEESCSRYMERMIKEKGYFKGAAIGLKRLLSCSSWS